MLKKIICALILIASPYQAVTLAQQGKIDVTFNTLDDGLKGDGFDNTVRTLFMQSDENLIVGGDYSSINGIPSPYLARLKPDGTIDQDFHTGTSFNGKIYAVNVQPDGKLIVAGNFTAYNGTAAGRLIRLNSDGSQDLSFNTSVGAATGIIYDISLQSDGKIIIVGSFTKYNNATVNRIARILPDGSLDASFLTGTGSSLNITNARVLSNGKILIAGNFESFNGTFSNRIVRLNSNGSVDASFNVGTGFNDNVNSVEIQSNGKILVGGNFTLYNEITANKIIRLNEGGTIDLDFIGSGFNNGAVQIIKTDAGDNIMVGGSFTGNYNGVDVNRAVLLNSNGTIQTDFDMGSGPGSASVLALASNSEKAWFIGGSFSVFDGLNQGRLAKVNSDGELETSYLTAGAGFDNTVYKMIPLQNKKTMVFGKFTKFNNFSSPRIARLLENGLVDPDFNNGQTGANNLIKTAVVQADNKFIIAGNFTKYNDIIYNRIVRILQNGSIDNTFNIGSGFNNQIYAMALQSDNKIIAAGNFTRYNDQSAGRIVRLLPDGSRDSTLNIGLGADAIIEDVLIQPDGKIVLGGRFTAFNGKPFSKIVRLNSDGSIDNSFNIGTGFDKNVYAIALQSDGKIIIGGSFLTYNGISQKRLLRLNSNGSLDVSFDSAGGFSNGDVRTILVQPDDRILVGGTFSGTYKNKAALRLIRLSKTGDFDDSFQAHLNNKLFALNFTSDYKLLIGGDFNSVSGISKHRIARLKVCLESTIWDGLSWSNGYPSGGKEVFFKEDFLDLKTSDVCSCTIASGKTVTLLSENTLGIEFSYSGLGTLVLEETSSLYQSDDEIINSGIVHVIRKTNPILKFDYTYWSTPVSNQKLFDVSPNTLSDKYMSYNAASQSWKIENPLNNMLLGTGYAIRGPQEFSTTFGSVYEANFIGIPNNGRVKAEISEPEKFNLIGNPYPSAVDADLFLTKNKSIIKGALYFWTHNTPVTNNEYSSNDYAVYNLVGGVGTKAGSNGINNTIPDGKIGSGQAFFIQSSGSGSLEFNNNMRSRVGNSMFFKPAKNKNLQMNDEFEKHRLWLNLKNEKGAFKQILLGYVTGATNLYDTNYDAESFNGNKFVDFYTIIENKKLVIQGRELPFQDSDKVIIGYKTTIAGDFTIAIDHADGDLINREVYLKDNVTDTLFDLRSGDYTFNSSAGSFQDRFELHFTNNNLSINDLQHTNEEIFVSVKNKIIRIKSIIKELQNVFVFDIDGKLLYENKKLAGKEFVISDLKSSNQVLLVKIILKNKHSITKKILF